MGIMEISRQTAEFVAAHRDEDVRALALRAKRCEGLDLPFALDQIAGRQTARRKLPDWAACDGIIYPPHLSMEQCSSQFTARYKAALARRLVGGGDATGCVDSGNHVDDTVTRGATVDDRPVDGLMVDLTGGFGVDCSYMARGFTRAVYVERQPHLCELAEHNMAALGLGHVRVVNADAETVLDALASGAAGASAATLLFIDPARRDEHGARTVAIEDCTPNVLALKDLLLAVAPCVMVKLSPMLDWRKAVADCAGAVAEVHIVSTGNECKELLLVLRRTDDRRGAAPVRVYCVNDDDVLDYAYDPSAPQDGRSLGLAALPEPMAYLYEPNASLMKAGCFALVERRYGVTQIGPSSHLFVADRPVPGFPGRAFAVDRMAGMGKRDLHAVIGDISQANIATRNFPLSVAQLRRKLRLRDGGDTYLFATTLAGGRHVLIRCTRL